MHLSSSSRKSRSDCPGSSPLYAGNCFQARNKMRRHELTDKQFNKIEHMLPERKGYVGVTAKDNRTFISRSRGGLSTKIHCIADGLGNPVDFVLTGGEVHDSQCADILLDGKKADFILADKAYDNDIILRKIEEMGATAVILIPLYRVGGASTVPVLSHHRTCDFAYGGFN